MAISNSIGSNVFDILVGLGLPWTLQTLCIDYGSNVSVASAQPEWTLPEWDQNRPKQPLSALISTWPEYTYSLYA